jgi:hypothetical protein
MNRSSVLDELEDEPPRQDTRGRWILLALLLSLAVHLAFIWWARSYDVPAFSDAYYDRIVPRAFKVDRVEIDSRLLDENTAAEAETTRTVTPAPVDLPEEDIAAEKAEVRAAPSRPGQLGLVSRPAKQP